MVAGARCVKNCVQWMVEIVLELGVGAVSCLAVGEVVGAGQFGKGGLRAGDDSCLEVDGS